MTLTYQQETGEQMVESILEEAKELFQANYLEMESEKDIALDIDEAVYEAMGKAGLLRVFTVRDDGVLVGYNGFIVSLSPHHKSTLFAIQDILYLQPKYRRGRVGIKLIKFGDELLTAEGVILIIRQAKAFTDVGVILDRLKYQLGEYIYWRRLNK